MGWYVDDRGVIVWKSGDENPDHDHVDVSVDKMDVEGGILDENEEETSNPNGSGDVEENPSEHFDDNPVGGVSDESEPLKNPNGKRNNVYDPTNSKKPQKQSGIGVLLAKLEALIFT